MELKQKKNQEDTWTESEIQKYQRIIENSKLPLFKLISDLSTKNTQNHEPFYIFFLEKSEYQKQLEKLQKENPQGKPTPAQQQALQKQPSNYEMKTRSIYKQPIRIQLLVNAIVKGSVGDKHVNKQYAFSKLFNTMKNNHVMQFIGEGFFEKYYISIYKCSVTDEILDHLFKKMVYVCKDSETVLLFKNESLSIKYESFQDFFLPQEENFKYYSVSDYLKKATYKLYEKALYFLDNHDNNAFSKDQNLNIKKGNQNIYSNLFGDLNEDIIPDPQEKAEYDKKLAENPRYKLEICHYYQTNSCTHKMNSVKCKFAHGEIELRDQGSDLSDDDDRDYSDSDSDYNSNENGYNKSSSNNSRNQYNTNNNSQKSNKSIKKIQYTSQENISSNGNSQNGSKPQQIQQKESIQQQQQQQQQESSLQNRKQSNNSDDYNSDCFFPTSSDDEEECKNDQKNNSKYSNGNNSNSNKIVYQVKQQSQQSTSSSMNNNNSNSKQQQQNSKEGDGQENEIGSLSMFCKV